MIMLLGVGNRQPRLMKMIGINVKTMLMMKGQRRRNYMKQIRPVVLKLNLSRDSKEAAIKVGWIANRD